MEPIPSIPSNRWNQARRVYLWIAAGLALLAAFSKELSVWKPTAYLVSLNSLLTFLSNRQFFLAVAVLELAVAAAIFFERFDFWTRVQWVFWLSLQFAGYRLILLLSKEPEPCKCFGDLFLWLGVSAASVDFFSKASLFNFLVPSGALLFWRRWQPRTALSLGANQV